MSSSWYNLARRDDDPYHDDWLDDGADRGEAAVAEEEPSEFDQDPESSAAAVLQEVFGSDGEAPGDEAGDSSSSSVSSSTDDESSVSADERLTACSSTYEVRDEVWRDCIMYRLKCHSPFSKRLKWKQIRLR